MTAAPLVLLAEPPATPAVWSDVARALAGTVRCVPVDVLPSSAGASRRSLAIDALSQRLARRLDDLGLDRVNVAAAGVSGAVAVDFAARRPGRVAALVLAGTPLHGAVWPPAAVRPLLVSGVGEAMLALARRDEQRAQRLAARLLASWDAPVAAAAWLREPGAGRNLLRLLRSIDMPTVSAARQLLATDPPACLVLWGQRDRQLPRDYGRRLARELGAAFEVVPDAGHLVMRDNPSAVAALLAAIVQRVAA